MTAADQAWAAASLRRFGPMAHRASKVRILEGRVLYEHPTQLLTFDAAENLAAAGLATTQRHGQECFSCTLTPKGEAHLDLLLADERDAELEADR
jgi:hypothetical protein